MKNLLMLVLLVMTASLSLTFACDDSDGDGDADSDADADSDSDADVQPGTCEAPPLAEGVLRNSIADIDFSGEEVRYTIEHKLDIDSVEDGCVAYAEFTVQMAGMGCEFGLVYSVSDEGLMTLQDAHLNADSFCPGWLDTDEGNYLLVAGDPAFSFVSRVPDRTAEQSCIGDVVASFGGTVELAAAGGTLEIDLSGLSFSGDFLSIGNTERFCPCQPACGERECGPDPSCGRSCGTCDASQSCEEGQCICPEDLMACGDECVTGVEACNGLDDDCDGAIDEDVGNVYYRDADADGYGTVQDAIRACAPPDGYVEDDADCFDNNAAINPGAAEISDGVDNNCDGAADEGLPCVLGSEAQCGEGGVEGECAWGTQRCIDEGAGAGPQWGDCEGVVRPVAEMCDGLDNDCDGEIDESCI